MKPGMPIGVIVKQINNLYEKEFNALLKTIGITASQCAVLDFLFYTDKEEVNQKDIETSLSLQNPTVTGLLKRLDEKGYILSVPSATDRRRKKIYLTEKAYDIRRVVEHSRKAIDKRLTYGLNEKEKTSLYKTLEKILYNVS